MAPWFTPGVSTPLVVSLATLCRHRRTELDITQAAVATALGISRSHYVAVEGARANPSAELMDRIAEVLGLRLHLTATPTVITLEAAVRDAVHARCLAYVIRRLAAAGWLVLRELPIEDGRYRGWIDAIAFDPRSGTLLIIEVKTVLDDTGRLERQVGWYERVVRANVPTAWHVTSVSVWITLLASAENDAAVARNHDALVQAFPARAPSMRSLLARTAATSEPDASTQTDPPATGQHGLALIDPRSRRRDWLIPTRLDGRRSPAPFQDLATARRTLGV